MKRNNIDIKADILSRALGGATKTNIVYGCNLNFNIVKRYLKELIERGLLISESPLFHTTDRGEKFLKKYSSMMEFA